MTSIASSVSDLFASKAVGLLGRPKLHRPEAGVRCPPLEVASPPTFDLSLIKPAFDKFYRLEIQRLGYQNKATKRLRFGTTTTNTFHSLLYDLI